MKKVKIVGLGAVLAAAAGSASATVPEAATNAIASIGTDAGTLLDSGWPILLAITGGFIVMKLAKRVMHRAS